MIYITWDEPYLKPRAEQLAKFLHLSLVPNEHMLAASHPQKSPQETLQETLQKTYLLRVSSEKLLLEYWENHHKHALYAEFLKGSLGFRRKHGGGLKQSLCRAVGVKNLKQGLRVLDGTAGLGKDAFILASVGCQVTLLERSPILFVLLEDGWTRALQDSDIQPIANNMHLRFEDLKDYLSKIQKTKFPQNELPDVIFLDPMFPPRSKSALTKMEMRIIRDIVGKDEDTEMLLTEALKLAKKRVVVKRPLHAPHLQHLVPDFVVSGKANRYDVYLTQTHRGNIKIHE